MLLKLTFYNVCRIECTYLSKYVSHLTLPDFYMY